MRVIIETTGIVGQGGVIWELNAVETSWNLGE